MSLPFRIPALVLAAVFAANATLAEPPAAKVRRAPTLNGKVEGSLHVMTAENITLNGSADIRGNLLVPGSPTLQLNGKPTYAGTLDGSGLPTPAGHKIIINSGARLGHVVRRTNPLALPVVASPPPPAGTRSVSLNQAGQSAGDFRTLKNLTLNSNVGPVPVPAGNYGNFISNSGSSFVLGVAGSPESTHYSFQNLTLNGTDGLVVVGPVVVTVAGGFSANAHMGNAAYPGWLRLRIAGGGLTVNGNRTISADLEAPDGTLTLNGSCVFTGAVAADRLVVNGGATLRLVPTVSGPNQPPTVTMTASPAGAEFTAPAALVLVATATDPDGSVARIEFLDNGHTLGESASGSGTLAVTLLAPGPHRLTARASDQQGAVAESAAIEVRVLPGLPYLAGFESGEGYAAGPLDGQLGWSAGSGAVRVSAEAAMSGMHGLSLAPGEVVALADQEFGPAAARTSPVFVELFARPGLGTTADTGSMLDLDNARLAFGSASGLGNLLVLDGDGQGGGFWRTLSAAFAARDGVATEWHRVTTRLDFHGRTWDAYLDGRMVAFDLGFRFGSATEFSGVTLRGATTAATHIDALYVGPENPLFADRDFDGMDDAWESLHGLDPATNDRAADADGDSLPNLLEFVLGTHPARADTDGDAVGDTYEVRHALNPLLDDATEDADWDGLTNLQEFRLGTSASSFDSDGDGLPDALEISYGFDPLRHEARTRLDADADGDGLTLTQELSLGTDPAVADDLHVGDDSDGDGLPDRWEIAQGTNPQVGEAVSFLNTDADGDGLTLVQEAQLGTNPAHADSDADGMPDGYEHHHGLDPTANDADGDRDGDGQRNFAEFKRGSDPDDYYDGREPEILQFIGGGFDLGARNVLAVRVTDKTGTPLVNAPLILELSDDDESLLALSPDGPPTGKRLEVRTGPGGIARVYLQAPR